MNLLKTLAVAALSAAPLFAYAAADFTTVRRTQIDLNDASPRLLIAFNLPSNLNVSGAIDNSAVLTLDALGVEFNYNEVYINPPTTVCTANVGDANQAKSVGSLSEHDDINLKIEWAVNQLVFSSSLLKPGTNQLMICVRSSTAGVGSTENVDDIGVRGVVLHYHTTP